MAIVPKTKYPSQTNAADPAYPQGKAQNVTTPGDGTGTPFTADVVNDIWGWQQALLAAASITPSGDPDEVGASDYLAALQVLFPAESRMDTAEADIAALEAFQTSADGRLDAIEALTAPLLTALRTRIQRDLVMTNWFERTKAGSYAGNFNGACAIEGTWGYYAGGTMIIVGSSGEIQISPDGLNWSNRPPGGTPTTFYAVATNGTNLVIAVGGGGGDIESSPDGYTWTARTPGSGYVGTFRDVCYSPTLGLWLAVGSSGEIQTSPDGIAWTKRTQAGAYAGDFRACAWSAALGLFCIVGTAGEIQTSPDGIAWTKRTPAASFAGTFSGVAWSAALGLFCIVGTTADMIQTSPDGINWTQRTAATALSNGFVNVCEFSGGFVAVNDTGYLMEWSGDGISWKCIPGGRQLGAAARVASAMGGLVLVGQSASISTSFRMREV